MTYDTIATISQVTSLLMFVAMFAAVLTYALWPSNGARFEAAQRHALDLAASSRGQSRESGRARGSSPASDPATPTPRDIAP